MAEKKGISVFWQTLTYPNFRNFMAGNFVSQMGLWSQRIAVQWLTWELTKDPFWLGLMAFADFFPILCMGPVAGAYADRLERLRAIRLYVFLSGVLSAVIAGLTIGDVIDRYSLLLLVFLNGTVLAFNYPFRLAIINELVQRDALTSAISINSIGFNLARIVGPALAGVIIANVGVGPAVIFTVFADIVFIIALYQVHLLGGDVRPEGKSIRDVPGEIIEGFRYVVRNTGFAPLLLVLLLITIFGRPLNELQAGFSDTVFGMGADGVAWLFSAFGAGAAVGCVELACYNGIKGLTNKMITNVCLLAVGVLGFVATDIFWFALLSIAVMGYAYAVLGIAELALLQAAVADDMRGRMMSFYSMISRGCPGFGALLMGYLATFAGLRIPIGAGAIICLAVWLWIRTRRDVMIEKLERTPE